MFLFLLGCAGWSDPSCDGVFRYTIWSEGEVGITFDGNPATLSDTKLERRDDVDAFMLQTRAVVDVGDCLGDEHLVTLDWMGGESDASVRLGSEAVTGAVNAPRAGDDLAGEIPPTEVQLRPRDDESLCGVDGGVVAFAATWSFAEDVSTAEERQSFCY